MKGVFMSDMQIATGILPVLPVHNVSETIGWYERTLGFTKLFEQPAPDGTVFTGQVQKQGSNIMFNLNPGDADKQGGGIYLWIRIEESDIDAFYTELEARGLTVVDALQDGFWGDRFFSIRDVNGYILAFNKSK